MFDDSRLQSYRTTFPVEELFVIIAQIMTKYKFSAALSFLIAALCCGLVYGTEDDAVNFSRDILPILSDKCFVCHGPDTHDEDMLRLDSFTSATVDRGGYFAIDPKTPEESAVLERIHSKDDPMPPEDAEKQLSVSERELLTKWIKNGGHGIVFGVNPL